MSTDRTLFRESRRYTSKEEETKEKHHCHHLHLSGT